MGVDGVGSPATFAAAAIIAASAVTTVSTLSKVLWWSLLRSQIGCGVKGGEDVVLACSVTLLSPNGCTS